MERVDLDQGTLQVRRIHSAAKGALTFTTPKNNKSRSARLTARAVQALRDHRKRQIEERLKHAGVWQEIGLVFTATVARPLIITTYLGAPLSFCCGVQVYRTSHSTPCAIASPRSCSPVANTLR